MPLKLDLGRAIGKVLRNLQIFSSRHLLDLESAKLALNLLKENFDFRNFYEEYRNNLQFKDALQNPFNDLTHEISDLQGTMRDVNPILYSFFSQLKKKFCINKDIYSLIRSRNIQFSEFFNLVDPNKSLDDLDSSPLAKLLPYMFYRAGIKELYSVKKLKNYHRLDDNNGGSSQLKPYERLLKVDLRKRKAQLVKEFEGYVDSEISIKNTMKDLPSNWDTLGYLKWNPQNARQRNEISRHLKVWKLRRQRKSFKEISKFLKITEEVAKKSFYRSYELTQGKKYDSEQFCKFALTIDKYELVKTCETCEDKECLKNLTNPDNWSPCPDVMLYINQDYVSIKEKIGGDPQKLDNVLSSDSINEEGSDHE